MSPVTCHPSHVTCHMSHVTTFGNIGMWGVKNVTGKAQLPWRSPVTCHLSHVICHMSHVTCHMCPPTTHTHTTTLPTLYIYPTYASLTSQNNKNICSSIKVEIHNFSLYLLQPPPAPPPTPPQPPHPPPNTTYNLLWPPKQKNNPKNKENSTFERGGSRSPPPPQIKSPDPRIR